ncbi:MAG: hypothetical protein IKH88_02010, partial [Prevotella sp.]|nr:hypothetical protein [Prevotella sp.]
MTSASHVDLRFQQNILGVARRPTVPAEHPWRGTSAYGSGRTSLAWHVGLRFRKSILDVARMVRAKGRERISPQTVGAHIPSSLRCAYPLKQSVRISPPAFGAHIPSN